MYLSIPFTLVTEPYMSSHLAEQINPAAAENRSHMYSSISLYRSPLYLSISGVQQVTGIGRYHCILYLLACLLETDVLRMNDGTVAPNTEEVLQRCYDMT